MTRDDRDHVIPQLTEWQRIAAENWTLIPEEQARPVFAHYVREGSIVLTVRAGWG